MIQSTEPGRPIRRSSRRRPVMLASAVTLAVGMTATTFPTGAGASTAKPFIAKHSIARPSVSTKGWTFAYVTGAPTDPFYITLHNGAFAEAKKLGIKLTYTGPPVAGSSPSVQVGEVNALLATHPTALMISPANVTALAAPIAKFQKAGIPVIAVDTTINDTKLLVGAITSDNYQGGEAAADAIAKQHNDTGKVAIENVPPGVSTTDARRAGFLAELKKYPKMSVIATENDLGEASLAEAQSKSLILANAKLVGIFATNLDGGEGAGDAVVADNDKGKISVVAYDAEPAEVNLMKEGVISILIMQQPTVEGTDAVKFLYDWLTGQKSLVPKELLIPNAVATTATANDPSVSKYYYGSTLATS